VNLSQNSAGSTIISVSDRNASTSSNIYYLPGDSIGGIPSWTSLTTSPTPISVGGWSFAGINDLNQIFAVSYSVDGTTTPILYFYSEPTVSNVCFPAGTPIQVDQGVFSIEKINPKIHTIDGKKIEGITKTVTKEKHLVCFEKHALKLNYPTRRTVTSCLHKVLHKGAMIEACNLVGKYRGVKFIPYEGEVLYNILMETHEQVSVNRMICETLDPNNGMAKLFRICSNMPADEKARLISRVNAARLSVKNKTK
jgi:hypothetical protein